MIMKPGARAMEATQFMGVYDPLWSTDGRISTVQSRSINCIPAGLYEHVKYVVRNERNSYGNRFPSIFIRRSIWEKASIKEQAKVVCLKQKIVIVN